MFLQKLGVQQDSGHWSLNSRPGLSRSGLGLDRIFKWGPVLVLVLKKLVVLLNCVLIKCFHAYILSVSLPVSLCSQFQTEHGKHEGSMNLETVSFYIGADDQKVIIQIFWFAEVLASGHGSDTPNIHHIVIGNIWARQNNAKLPKTRN